MPLLTKNEFSVSSAIGKGDWHRVILLEQEALATDPKLKQFHYAMIGYANQNLGELETAKTNYGKALGYDPCCEMALQGLAEVYVK